MNIHCLWVGFARISLTIDETGEFGVYTYSNCISVHIYMVCTTSGFWKYVYGIMVLQFYFRVTLGISALHDVCYHYKVTE